MDRVKAIIADREYQDYLALISEAERDRLYCKHDYQHALYVARLSYLIAIEEKIVLSNIKELIYAAGLLHDIGRWQEYSTGTDHCEASSVLALPILQRAGYLNHEIESISTAIREHRKPKDSQIGRLLALADDLSRDCMGCPGRCSCYKLEKMLRLQANMNV